MLEEKMDAARSMGADRASEDKGPDVPEDLSDEEKVAWYEGFIGAVEAWVEDLLDRGALAEELAEKLRGGE